MATTKPQVSTSMQGCERDVLLPLVYAIIADVILERIGEECLNALVRAYAIDTPPACRMFPVVHEATDET